MYYIFKPSNNIYVYIYIYIILVFDANITIIYLYNIGVTNRDKRSSFVPVATPGTKGHLLLSRTGVAGWKTGTTAVSQSGQINVFVVVGKYSVHRTIRADLGAVADICRYQYFRIKAMSQLSLIV